MSENTDKMDSLKAWFQRGMESLKSLSGEDGRKSENTSIKQQPERLVCTSLLSVHTKLTRIRSVNGW